MSLKSGTKCIFLCEGADDTGVLYHVLCYCGYKRQISDKLLEIKNCEGISNLIAQIPIYLKGTEVTHLGIVVDADKDLNGRWDAIKSALGKGGYKSLPRRFNRNSAIHIEDERIPLGVWIMPNNQDSGAIEEFVTSLIPSNDALWIYAQDVIQEVSGIEQRFTATHALKARLHTWLAWQKEPGPPMGLAITRRYLDPSCPECESFSTWLRTLINT